MSTCEQRDWPKWLGRPLPVQCFFHMRGPSLKDCTGCPHITKEALESEVYSYLVFYYRWHEKEKLSVPLICCNFPAQYHPLQPFRLYACYPVCFLLALSLSASFPHSGERVHPSSLVEMLPFPPCDPEAHLHHTRPFKSDTMKACATSSLLLCLHQMPQNLTAL